MQPTSHPGSSEICVTSFFLCVFILLTAACIYVLFKNIMELVMLSGSKFMTKLFIHVRLARFILGN